MKMRANLFTDGIHHLILADLLERGKLEDHLKRLSCQHTALRNLAVQSLREVHASSLVRFEVPQGGLYLWCGVPYHLDLSVAINRMEREGVSVAPGQAFYSNGRGEHHFRLCFTATSAERLARGTAIIACVLRRAAARYVLSKPFRQQMVGHADSVGNNSQRRMTALADTKQEASTT